MKKDGKRQWTPVEGGYEKYKTDFQTPPEIAKYMVSLLPEDSSTILEPTPGVGNIQREIIKSRRRCIAPEDYFTLDPDIFIRRRSNESSLFKQICKSNKCTN